MSFQSPQELLHNKRLRKIEDDTRAMRQQIEAKMASPDYRADGESSRSRPGGGYVYRRRGEITLNVSVEPEAVATITAELQAKGWTVEDDWSGPGSSCHYLRIYY